MKLRDWICYGLMCSALFLFVGCQTGSGGGGGGGGSGDAVEDGGDGTAGGGEGDPDGADGAGGAETEDGGDAGGTEDGEGTADEEGTADDEGLTEEELATVDATVSTIKTLSSMFGGVGAADLPDPADGPVIINPAPLSECPIATVEEGLVVFDFDEGCSPVLYPDSTFSGSVTVEVNPVAATLILTFNTLTIDGDTIDGIVEASIGQDGEAVALDGSVDLTFSTGGADYTLTGDMTVNIDLVTGEVLVSTADLTLTDPADQSYALTLTNVHADPLGNVNFLPDSGTATVVVDTDGPGDITLEITFSETTPTDGTVTVSVNGGPAIEVTLADLFTE